MDWREEQRITIDNNWRQCSMGRCCNADKLLDMRKMVTDFQDRYHGALEEQKKMVDLLKEVYDYFDVDNEGVTAEEYSLIEKIREVIE